MFCNFVLKCCFVRCHYIQLQINACACVTQFQNKTCTSSKECELERLKCGNENTQDWFIYQKGKRALGRVNKRTVFVKSKI